MAVHFPECTITATADITKQDEVERAIHDFTKEPLTHISPVQRIDFVHFSR